MKPVLQALVLAERIYTDQTGKKIIAGTFNRVLIRKTSAQERKQPDGQEFVQGGTDPGCPSIYISLTDVVEGTEITLQFVNVSKNMVLFGTAFKLQPTDRLATIEIVAALPPLSRFAKERGTFSLDIVWNREILGSHRILFEEASTGSEVS